MLYFWAKHLFFFLKYILVSFSVESLTYALAKNGSSRNTGTSLTVFPLGIRTNKYTASFEMSFN